jgi:hypothetical protein
MRDMSIPKPPPGPVVADVPDDVDLNQVAAEGRGAMVGRLAADPEFQDAAEGLRRIIERHIETVGGPIEEHFGPRPAGVFRDAATKEASRQVRKALGLDGLKKTD